MPSFHIVQTGANDYDEVERQAAEGHRPRHSVPVLARRLAARLHQTEFDGPPASLGDRLRARLVGTPRGWALARSLASRLGRDDVVFCLDADAGIPLAAALKGRRDRPKLVVYLHNIDRPRGRAAVDLLRIGGVVDVFTSCCSSQLEFIRGRLGLGEDRTRLLLQHVDNRFFTPGPPAPGKRRPAIVSVGLEQRDYVTVAAAARDLDVDVWVDAWSPNARKSSRAFPAELPANMSYRRSTSVELVQLYRDADAVVVSMFPNRYAGLTTLVEGLACERPVVASRTVGLADYLEPPDGITPVEPCDPAAMRAAIVQLIERPDEAREQARRGYESVSRRYDFDAYIEMVAAWLESL